MRSLADSMKRQTTDGAASGKGSRRNLLLLSRVATEEEQNSTDRRRNREGIAPLPLTFILKTRYRLIFAAAILFTSCEGIFQGIYDVSPAETKVKAGQFFVDASSWDDWLFLDFKALHDSLQKDASFNPSDAVARYPVPTEESSEDLSDDNPDASGIYVYWYDVFGAGTANRSFQRFIPTRQQDEPPTWSVAFHRNNVRTNGAAVFKTEYTQMNDLPESSAFFIGNPFAEDEWNETDVWVRREQMLNGIIGSQGIKVNSVLSSWLTVEIPPMPPAFVRDSHVFIVRLPDGTSAAMQLENYQNDKGVKCMLTINYIYPY